MNEMSHLDVELILVDPNDALCREWETAFAKRPGYRWSAADSKRCRSLTVWSVRRIRLG